MTVDLGCTLSLRRVVGNICRSSEVIEWVIGMGSEVLTNLGSDGYQKAWGKPFPLDLMSALRSVDSV